MKTLVKLIVCLFVTGCSAHVQNPRGNDEDGGQPPVLVVVPEDAGSDATEAPDAVTAEEVSVEVVVEVAEEVEEVAAPQTLAEKFVAADGEGGMKLCVAMIEALSPDWNLKACEAMQDDVDGGTRRSQCFAQREPLKLFAQNICTAVIEEALRLNLDPALPLVVMERESSIGRVHFDAASRTYEVQTDVCALNLSATRIVKRECLSGQTRCGSTCFNLTTNTNHCGTCENVCSEHEVCVSGACRAGCAPEETECNGTCVVLPRYRTSCPSRSREGQEMVTWTYGDDQRQNRQRVIITTENADGSISVDTCASGETGLFQLLPSNYHSGTVIEATGQRLTGTAARREAVLEDPILQVRLGCQELARHRDLCPEDRRSALDQWVPTYNLGECNPAREQWQVYLSKILRHYNDACERGWIPSEDGMPVLVRDLWPECTRIKAAYDALPVD